MLIIQRWASDLIGLLFPELCNACGAELLLNEAIICTKCLYDLPFTDYHLHAENRVAKQLWGRVDINAAMAMLYFRKGTKVQNLIHSLKYKGKTEVGLMLGKMLGERLQGSQLYAEMDAIIPVPLHPSKLRLRGFNQSAFIAEGISLITGIGVNEKLLRRLVGTESQTKKNRYSRYENMQHVFEVDNSALIKGRHVLLVDDVVTTGATLEACANALLLCGANKVSIAALAFAE
ncbi:ComF family protein [Pedobacter endophyticus]|uniref:ComF family protein n=1 Tax=Pedobacter endophyticus TaxID=2789740 RepID=A0A7U3Q4C1_9SPHI|nr:ComF family protein [Pedobacter endophyticus]QPH38371.1 ComF family protein [Pedobacter endophyticus]